MLTRLLLVVPFLLVLAFARTAAQAEPTVRTAENEDHPFPSRSGRAGCSPSPRWMTTAPAL